MDSPGAAPSVAAQGSFLIVRLLLMRRPGQSASLQLAVGLTHRDVDKIGDDVMRHWFWPQRSNGEAIH